jgi:multidrug efflux pump subunit AcrA (membrane-fusion protein)
MIYRQEKNQKRQKREKFNQFLTEFLLFCYLCSLSLEYQHSKETKMEKKNDSQRQSKLKKGLFTLGFLLVAAGLLLGPTFLAGNSYTAEEQQVIETPVFSVRTHEVARQTLYAHLDVNGDIVSSQQVDVFPDVAGMLVSVNAALGTFVRQGDVIAMVDPSRPGATFMNSAVYAPISGFVSRTPLSVGMTVAPNMGITTISSNGSLEINARIPEREIAGLAPGLRAEVSLQAHPGETFNATVNRVSPVVDNVSRTKLINLRFDQNDNRVSPGMFARLRLNTRTYPNVLSIPAEAVSSIRGVDTVFVIAMNEMGQTIAERREVIKGVTLQGWTEIRTGLNEGEAIIVQGQQLLSGGESVRILGSIAQGSN